MLVAVAVLIILYITYWWTNRHLWIHAKNLPGPRWLPFIGNLTWASNNGLTNFKSVLLLTNKYGHVFRVWFGPKLYVFLSDPEVIGKVLGNPRVHDLSPMVDKAIRLFFGNGSVALSGDAWKYHLKLIAPAFNRQIMQTYVQKLAENASVLEDNLIQIANGRPVNVSKIIGQSIMNALKESVIGVESQTHCTIDSTILTRTTDLIVRRTIHPWLLIDWIYRLTSDGQKAAGYVKILQEFTAGVIAEKQDEYRRGIKRSGIVTSGDKKINSFLDMMLEATETQGSPLSADDLRDEVKALFMAGTETTTLTISYFLLLVAIHSDVQDQIHQELDDIFAGDQRLVTAEDLNKMDVLERAIKETMRLFPTAPIQTRLLPEDIPIGNGMTLPKDTVAVVYPYTLHRNEGYFKDVHSFCPDRWLSSDKLHPYAYLPFSGGARTCVGRHFAMLQMKCTLSTVMRQLKVSTHLTLDVITSNLLAGMSLGFNPDVGFMIQLNRRNSDVLLTNV